MPEGPGEAVLFGGQSIEMKPAVSQLYTSPPFVNTLAHPTESSSPHHPVPQTTFQ